MTTEAECQTAGHIALIEAAIQKIFVYFDEFAGGTGQIIKAARTDLENSILLLPPPTGVSTEDQAHIAAGMSLAMDRIFQRSPK